jgi:hypothetical protein
MSNLKATKIFELMDGVLKEKGESFVKLLNASYAFEVVKNKGDKPEVWTIDLKSGKGSIAKGLVGKPDVVFSMNDDDIYGMAQGTVNPQ